MHRSLLADHANNSIPKFGFFGKPETGGVEETVYSGFG